MAELSTHEVTQLLVAQTGSALHGNERAGHPLQPAALVNEVYMRLIDWKNLE
ncbi:MAG: hypothetical protein JNK38_03495 [Acidobacteria bacterium]|nr:hypothetical protein [Acidobacteriota bacterium]